MKVQIVFKSGKEVSFDAENIETSCTGTLTNIKWEEARGKYPLYLNLSEVAAVFVCEEDEPPVPAVTADDLKSAILEECRPVVIPEGLDFLKSGSCTGPKPEQTDE